MPRGSFATPLAEQKILVVRKTGGVGKHEQKWCLNMGVFCDC
jgi:hypothetical protein